MSDDERPAGPGGWATPSAGPDKTGYGDSRYWGPFGRPAEGDEPARPGWGGWPAPDDYRAPEASAGVVGPGASGTGWPAPASPAAQPAAAPRRMRTGPVVLVAALTALLVGGGAGYAGSLLGARTGTSADPAASSVPSAAPTTAGPGSPPSSLPPAPAQIDTVEIARRVLPGTVMIEVGDATGSGLVIDDDGRILTNNHVVAGAADGDRIRIQFGDGARRTARLVGRSPSYDIAVVKVSGAAKLSPLVLGDSDALEVGQPVIAVGSPLGLPGTVTQGIVSARHRPVVVNGESAADAPVAYIDAVQTDAPINPGNSGGPLIDAGGRVIGVNSAILTLGTTRSQSGNIGLGFAIPVNQARVIADELINKGRATYPVIGATVQDGDGGARITSLEPSGPARKAGLRKGDTITGIEGSPVESTEELIVAIRTHRPGEVVRLDYSRGSAKRQARVTLGGKEG